MNQNTEHGQGTAEYALLGLLVVAVVALALIALGPAISDLYSDATDEVLTLNADDRRFSLQEDFSDLEDWLVAWGEFETEDGKLIGGRWGGMFHKTFYGTDYTINVEDALLNQGNGYGIFFRAQDPDNTEGYIFQYDPGYSGGAFIFRKWVNGRETAPFEVVRASDYDWHGESHDIELQVEGNTFTAYVDGEQVATATDDTYTEGTVGFRTWDSTSVEIDSMTVTTP